MPRVVVRRFIEELSYKTNENAVQVSIFVCSRVHGSIYVM